MRDDSYLDSEVEAEEAASKWRGRAATAIGALLSVAILAGVVIWSYRLGVRDAAEIPVIRAELGATKQRPEEPGGLEVDYQSRAVYGVLSGADEETGPVAYAEAPEPLAAEDVASIERAPAPAPRPAPSPAPAPAEAAAVQAPVTAPETPAPAPEPLVTAERAPAAAAPQPGSPGSDSAAPRTAALSSGAEEETGNGLAPPTAPVAPPRPDRVAEAPAAVETPEPRAAALASRVQIQLGAFVSNEVAEAQWREIKARNGDLLAGRGSVITPVLSGGRRLFRLRAGPFADVEEAAALCRGLKARNEDCIVARREN